MASLYRQIYNMIYHEKREKSRKKSGQEESLPFVTSSGLKALSFRVLSRFSWLTMFFPVDCSSVGGGHYRQI